MKMEGLLGTSSRCFGGNFQHAMFDYQRIAVFSTHLGPLKWKVFLRGDQTQILRGFYSDIL